MAKRGRKPGEKRKGYFYEIQEQAVLDYLHSDDMEEKNRIYVEILKPAFEKMVESIIRRYHLFIPNEEFEDTFRDTLSFILMKADKFKPIKYGYKETKKEVDKTSLTIINEKDFEEYDDNADENSPLFLFVEDEEGGQYYERVKTKQRAYSYYGTVCKNYLIGKIDNYIKTAERNPTYDSITEKFGNSMRYSDAIDRNGEIAIETVNKLSKRIQKMVDEPEENDMRESEVKLGRALVNLFENWDYVLTTNASNKLNKNAILLFLRENTGLDTKGIRDNMKKFKKEFLIIKNYVIG